MSKKLKELKDLTDKELMEDLAYYVKMAQTQSPPFVDSTFNCIWDDIKEFQKRWKKEQEELDYPTIIEGEPIDKT